ncbi:MAG: YCF48-related protein [Bacteroidota bacterium]
MECPDGFEPTVDIDGDCVDDVLERQGFWYRDNQLQACDPVNDTGCFVTDPTAWSSDGDPYSDFQEATGVNMDNTVAPPYNNPLVAAEPRIEVVLLRYRFVPKATITDSNGQEMSAQSTQEFSVETSVGISYTSGVEVSAGLDAGVTASTETTASFSVTAGFSSSQTRGTAINWETATTSATDDAASLFLDIAGRNVGSATALDVTPIFNLFIGDEPLGTVRPSEPFPANVRPGETSDFIVVSSRKEGNTEIPLTLSFDQLRQLQRGVPLKIQVIGLDAGISRWRPEESNWSCPDPCKWEEFQDQIDARTLRLLVDFGYSGTRNERIPRAFTGNPFEYRVYTGSPSANQSVTLGQALQHIGYDLAAQGDQILIENRPYPSQWYFTSGPDTGGASRDSTFKDYWDFAGQPSDVLNMDMPRGVSLLMASPDPEDSGPFINGHWFNEAMNQLTVFATAKGSIPVEGGEVYVTYIDGREEVMPLTRFGESGFFRIEEPTPFPIVPARSSIVMRDVLGNERRLESGLNPSIPIASSCAEIDVRYFRAPRFSDDNGTATLFIGGDLNKPATAFCFNTDGGTDVWFPQVGADESDMLGIALLDPTRRVAVGHQRILYSDNAGNTWRDIPLSAEEATTYRAVEFKKGTETGVAVGDNGIFMRTEDGGNSWVKVGTNATEGAFHDVDHAEGDMWFAVGNNQLLRSTDDGQTWGPMPLNTLDLQGNPVAIPFQDLRTVSFISNTVGVIGDHALGQVFQTEDGGETWNLRLLHAELNDITYDGEDAWYIVGRHVVQRFSTNASAREVLVFAGSFSLVLEAITFPTPEVGYVINAGGQVFQTNDRGQTWSSPFGGYPTPSHPGSNLMTDIDMFDVNFGGVVGTAGVIGATDSGGGVPQPAVSTTAEKEGGRELPAQITLEQNYPNPFNPTTTIAYSLSESQDVKLEIFDLLGRNIATLVDGVQVTGMHTVRFDATGLSSGMYLYRLSTKHATEVRRMLLLR